MLLLLLFSFCIIVFHALWLVSLHFSSKPTLSAIVFIKVLNLLTSIALAQEPWFFCRVLSIINTKIKQ